MEQPVGAQAGGAEITQDDKLWSLLSYIFCPIIGIVVLLMEDKKNRPFLRYHAVVSIAVGVVTIVLSWACVGIIVWAYGIYVGIKAYKGEMVEVPVITNFCRKQGWI
jgi:uncharacterized membrane protein